jgi:Zincin-like metallopeptidase
MQSERQREILDRLTSVMTLVEGHGDYVMDAVGPAVVPSVDQIRAKFNARRTSGNRLEQAIRRILGIDLKMRQYQQGAAFVRAVVGEAGMETFNRVWTSPETLPAKEELTSPRLWLERVGGSPFGTRQLESPAQNGISGHAAASDGAASTGQSADTPATDTPVPEGPPADGSGRSAG